VDGLRVIDSSVFPTVPSSNTNAPTIALGEKGADLVLRSWKNIAAAYRSEAAHREIRL
jgi:choline dehydrogenase-like flavoprotein